MGKTYEKADEGVMSILGEMMRRHHHDLVKAGTAVDVLMVSDIDPDSHEVFPALKLHGYPAAATVRVVPLAQRVLGQGDALITIDACTWARLSGPERRACLDHELEHLELVIDPEDGVKRDDLGRPKLKLRLHDWNLQGFDVIARRHGPHALEVKAVRACQDESGQMRWEFDMENVVEFAPAGTGGRAAAAH